MGVKTCISLVLSSVLFCGVVCAQEKVAGEMKKKGASESAYEHASENSVFNRVGDWFSTIGKSKEEKEKILMERKRERSRKRAQEMADEAGKKAMPEQEQMRNQMQHQEEHGAHMMKTGQEMGSMMGDSGKGKKGK